MRRLIKLQPRRVKDEFTLQLSDKADDTFRSEGLIVEGQIRKVGSRHRFFGFWMRHEDVVALRDELNEILERDERRS